MFYISTTKFMFKDLLTKHTPSPQAKVASPRSTRRASMPYAVSSRRKASEGCMLGEHKGSVTLLLPSALCALSLVPDYQQANGKPKQLLEGFARRYLEDVSCRITPIASFDRTLRFSLSCGTKEYAGHTVCGVIRSVVVLSETKVKQNWCSFLKIKKVCSFVSNNHTPSLTGVPQAQ